MAVDDEESLHRAIARIGYPCVLKTRTLGYDGTRSGGASRRGRPCESPRTARGALHSGGVRPVRFRGQRGAGVGRRARDLLPVGRNIHKDGILDLCIVPAGDRRTRCGSDGVPEQAFHARLRLPGDSGHRIFHVKGDGDLFNEMAPRPHNSGHWTIEGSTTNQFRSCAVTCSDMPLEEPQLEGPYRDEKHPGTGSWSGARRVPGENRPDVYVHIYGKTVSKPKRKMGHVTFVGCDRRGVCRQVADRFVK